MSIRNKAYIKAFGANLRKLRKDKGLSQLELSYNCAVERSQIARIERGEVNCTISMVVVLAKGLDMNPAALFNFSFDIDLL